jgi:hypothetical protein
MPKTSRFLSIALLVGAGGCGGGGPSSPSGQAVLSLSLAPNPLPEAVCPPSACGVATGQVYAIGTLTVRETAGVAGRIDVVSMTQRTVDGTVMASGQFDAAAIAALAGTNRFASNGTVTIPAVGVHYDQALGHVAATVTVVVQATDESGHAVSAMISAPVTPLR